MFAVTRRLTLRPGWAEDAGELAAAIGHEAVVRNLSRAPWPYRVEDAATFLALPRDPHDPVFQIRERAGAYALLGGIGLHRERDGWEIGYWLAPHAWGRGLATEAGTALIDIARHALGLDRIVGRHFVDNPASGRVLAKLGFRPTGRSRLPSLARGREAECVNHELVLRADAEDERPPMPMAA